MEHSARTIFENESNITKKQIDAATGVDVKIKKVEKKSKDDK